MRSAALTGAGLVALYTLMISVADGVTKRIAGSFEAPQLFFISAAMVLLLSLGVSRYRGQSERLATSCPWAMAARAGLTVLACLSFFMAFRHLLFADVFLFVGLIPVIAALMSGPVLNEPIRPMAWAALGLGALGILCMMPEGPKALQVGHLWAFMGAVSGTASMVIARYIGRIESNALAQVFWPQLAIFATMGLALPFVWKPMSGADLAWIAVYALGLFGARWVVVVALRLLPAYVATPLMNLQFVWMVLIGWAAYGEWPAATTFWGVAMVMGSGLWLVIDEMSLRRVPA
ncbi:DMT family transporter [Litorisediminicola beolgyonensis]|uniref:DMT family transporter n=1 Tax=Litorisediminicola beolgyonensis TaxID=1173614 RepID=A0ABW3ZMR2_9RHOB